MIHADLHMNLSTQYITNSQTKKIGYSSGIPVENIIVIVNEDTICAYLTSISKSSSMYISSYCSWITYFVFFSSRVHPLSLHLRHDLKLYSSRSTIRGINILMTIVRVIVDPTARYHELSKSMNFPLKIGNPSGRLSSGILEFTNNSKSTVLIHSNKNSLGTVDTFS